MGLGASERLPWPWGPFERHAVCNWFAFRLLLGAGSRGSLVDWEAFWTHSTTPAFTLHAPGRAISSISKEGRFSGPHSSLGASCLNLLHYPPSCSSCCFSCSCRRSS